MGLTSLTTVASFDSVGAIIVVALLAVPTASSYLVNKKLNHMIILSCIFGILTSILGYCMAYFFDVPVSGSMAVVAGLIFILTFVLHKYKYKQ